MGCKYVTITSPEINEDVLITLDGILNDKDFEQTLERKRSQEQKQQYNVSKASSFKKSKSDADIGEKNFVKIANSNGIEAPYTHKTYVPKISRIPNQKVEIPDHIKKYQTQDQLTAKHASTYLITCMDFRLIDDVCKVMDLMGFNNNYDHFIVAGGSLGLIQDKFPHWGQTAIDHMEIGLNLHEFRKIMLIDHEDCGAFKKFMPYQNKDEEYSNHKTCMQKAYHTLAKKFPDFEFSVFMMDLYGNVAEMQIDRTTIEIFDEKTVNNERSRFLSEIEDLHEIENQNNLKKRESSVLRFKKTESNKNVIYSDLRKSTRDKDDINSIIITKQTSELSKIPYFSNQINEENSNGSDQDN